MATHQNETPTERKLALIREKQQELQELILIKQKSDELLHYFEELASCMQDLSHGVQGVASTLANWDHVFRTMALMNARDEEVARDTTLVRLPIVNPKAAKPSSSQ